MKSGSFVLALMLLFGLISSSKAEVAFVNYTNGNTVQTLAFEGDSILWAGGTGGVVRWNLSDGTYRKFTTSDGLTDNCVYAIAIDSEGNKWFGTKYGGVSRFDGTNWTTYNTSDGLADNRRMPYPNIRGASVSAIAIDPEGNKWFGTSGIFTADGGGVSKFDGSNWTTYNTSNSYLPDNSVTAIAIDPEGNLWFGTWGGGVSRFDGSHWITYNSSNSYLASDYVTAIAIDSEGNKWFGTTEAIIGMGGLSRFDGNNWTTYTVEDGLASNNIICIAIDPEGNKWLGTEEYYTGSGWEGGGVSKFDGTNWTTYTTSNSGLTHDIVSAIAIDASGNKWFGTVVGVIKFDGTTWTTYTTSDELADNSVNAIAIDTQGNKWFGTGGGGVNRFDGSNWTTYTTEDGLASNNINCIAIDSESNKWFGTKYGGVSRFDGSNWTTYNTEDGLASNNVNCIVIDSEGNMWFGTSEYWTDNEYEGGGVSKFDGTNWATYTTSNSGLASNDVYAIAIDSSGNKWFGTEWGGVSKFDGTNWTTYNTSNSGLSLDIVYAIAIDTQGNKWFGTRWGVSRFDGSEWITYTIDDGLAHNDVYAIAIDASGNKWFGTWRGGVSRFDGTNWTTYTTADGLASDAVWSIAIDASGNKWFGTFGGVSMLAAPLLSVTAPLDGETWVAGTTRDITWESVSVNSVMLEISYDNGLSWEAIALALQAAPGTYSWTVPEKESAQCLIRITCLEDTAVTDQSDAVFCIKEFEPGDVGGDGKVNIFDLLDLLKVLGGASTEAPNADVNSDGKTDIFDLLALLKILSGSGEANLASAGNFASGMYRGLEYFFGKFYRITFPDGSVLEFKPGASSVNEIKATKGIAASILNTGAEVEISVLPKAFSLSRNSPNPFNPSTTISYNVPEAAQVHVSLRVFNLRGRLVRTLVEEVREAGAYSVIWDGRDESGRKVASGVYLYRMQAGDFSQTRKMVLLK